MGFVFDSLELTVSQRERYGLAAGQKLAVWVDARYRYGCVLNVRDKIKHIDNGIAVGEFVDWKLRSTSVPTEKRTPADYHYSILPPTAQRQSVRLRAKRAEQEEASLSDSQARIERIRQRFRDWPNWSQSASLLSAAELAEVSGQYRQAIDPAKVDAVAWIDEVKDMAEPLGVIDEQLAGTEILLEERRTRVAPQPLTAAGRLQHLNEMLFQDQKRINRLVDALERSLVKTEDQLIQYGRRIYLRPANLAINNGWYHFGEPGWNDVLHKALVVFNPLYDELAWPLAVLAADSPTLLSRSQDKIIQRLVWLEDCSDRLDMAAIGGDFDQFIEQLRRLVFVAESWLLQALDADGRTAKMVTLRNAIETSSRCLFFLHYRCLPEQVVEPPEQWYTCIPNVPTTIEDFAPAGQPADPFLGLPR